MRFWDKNYSVFKKVLPAPSWLTSLLNSSQLNGVGRKFVPCSRLSPCLAWNLDLGGSKRLLQRAQPSLKVVKGRLVGAPWQGLPVGHRRLFISLEGGGKTKMEEEEQNQEQEWGRKKHCCSSLVAEVWLHWNPDAGLASKEESSVADKCRLELQLHYWLCRKNKDHLHLMFLFGLLPWSPPPWSGSVNFLNLLIKAAFQNIETSLQKTYLSLYCLYSIIFLLFNNTCFLLLSSILYRLLQHKCTHTDAWYKQEKVIQLWQNNHFLGQF